MTGNIKKHATEKTKWFRIAVEGATTDKRTIERAWIEQAAQNYDRELYGARINLEHIKGVYPDGPFKAYGDVLELKAEEGTGKLAGKLCLFARIQPTADLVAMTKNGQKIYTSCELDPDWSDTGEAYLVALAVTDNPASLGTSILEFSANNPDASPLAKRKQSPHNLFTAATEELVLDMEPAAVGAGSVLLSKVKAMLGGSEKKQTTEMAEQFTAVEEAIETVTTHFNEQIQTLTASNKALTKTVNDLVTKLSATTDDTQDRPLVTGGAGAAEELADC